MGNSESERLLVGTDARRLQRFGGKLFIFVRDEVHAGGELVDVGALPAEIEDADFRIGDTAIEARLGVWLQDCQRLKLRRISTTSGTGESEWMVVKSPSHAEGIALLEDKTVGMPYLVLAIPITSGRTASHFGDLVRSISLGER